MSAALHLSRARLRAGRGEALSAIAPILMPSEAGRRAGLAHRVVWLLFQDVPDSERDFLWRDDGEGRLMILSRRPPTDSRGLFELDTQPFEPALSRGDRLRFVLRANPVVARRGARTREQQAARGRGRRVDVVMDALSRVPTAERAAQRDTLAAEAGLRWLAEQGARAGFVPQSAHVSSYAQIDISDEERRRRRDRARISVMDLQGTIEVSDPALFLARLADGFGKARAFGCGLMLIRRA